MLSSEIIRKLREEHAEADKELVQVIVCTFASVYCIEYAAYH